MKNLTKNLILIVFLLTALAACGYKPVDVGTKKFNIGAIHALSGNNAVYGQAMKKGMDLVVEEFNQKNKKYQFDIIYEDHMADPKIAINAYSVLKSKNVKIISTSFSNIILGLSPWAQQDQSLLINSGATSKDIKKQGKFVLSTVPDSELEVVPLADYAYKQDYKNVAIIYVNYQFGQDQKNIFKESFEGLGGKIIIEEGLAIDDNSYKTSLIKIEALQPDVIFIATLAKDTALIVKQAKELGVDTPLITTQTSVSIKALQEIYDLADGLVIAGPRFDLEQDVDSEFIKLKKAFFDKYQEYPDYFATTYYDSTRMVIDGILYCGSDQDAECVSDYIMNLKNFDGASGRTTFVDTTVEKPIDIKVFEDGEIRTLVFN